MQWVKFPIVFDARYVVFLVSLREHPEEWKMLSDAIQKEWRSDVEDCLYAFILKHRPELAGCTLYSVGMNPATIQIEIGVTHASLPRVGMGGEARRFMLIESEVPA